ncbi:MAG: hypothetical protein P8175_17640 [Deltaproteobacteria bacterium]
MVFKGRASPLFYSLWLAAGKVTEGEMMTYRQFGSPLEGHSTVSFPYTEAASGSLGRGSQGTGGGVKDRALPRMDRHYTPRSLEGL